MREEILRILEMEKQGKLTMQQAAELLAALAEKKEGTELATGKLSSPSSPPPPAPGSGSGPFATMRGVVSTSGVLIADAVQAAVKSAVSAVHHKDGNNSITMSRYESPVAVDSVFGDNSINVSQFSRVQLAKSRMCGNSLQASTLANLRLSEASLCDCSVNGSSMDDVEITASKMVDCELNGTKFTKVRISGNGPVENCVFSGATVRDLSLTAGGRMKDCRLSAATLASVTMENSSLQGVSMQGSTVSDTRFKDTNWRDVEMSESRLSGAQFNGCEFGNVAMKELRSSGGTGATGAGGGVWTNCRLHDVRFVRCELDGGQFYDLDLKDQRIEGVNFTGKTIRGNEEFMAAINASGGASGQGGQ